MSQSGPQTLSVKRKRTEAPVDALILENSIKRQKSTTFEARPTASPSSQSYYKRLAKPNDSPQQSLAPSTPAAERRFRLDAAAKARNKHFFVEARANAEKQAGATEKRQDAPAVQPTQHEPVRPRKRPGAGSALHPTAKPAISQHVEVSKPTAQDMQELEELSKKIDREDNLLIPLPSPTKHKPKAPAQRFAQRHPEKAAAMALADESNGDAMDIDGDEYVYDTYIREVILPGADGKLSEPTGTVGFLVIDEEDEDWWNGEDESDKEFDTDDEDENAEDYYANDYPEDELDDDDEYDRNPYQSKNRHGSDDEEYDLDDDDDAVGSDQNEDDMHFKLAVPKIQRPGYWGTAGET